MRLWLLCLWSLFAVLRPLPCQSAPRASTRPSTRSTTRAAPGPFLWRVEGVASGWLFGTIHVADRRVTRLPEIVVHAVEDSHVLYTEIDLTGDLSVVLRHFALPGRETLDQVLPMRVWERLQRLDPDSALRVKRLRPWAAALMLGGQGGRDGGLGARTLDQQLVQLARDSDLESAALETVVEQADALAGMTLNEQVLMLDEELDQMEKRRREPARGPDAVVELYLAGDETALTAGFDESRLPRKLLAKYRKLLLDDRNLRMADRLIARMAAAPKREHFVAVGAGHMVGAMGLPELLRARGFKVTRAVRELVTLCAAASAGGGAWRYTVEAPPEDWNQPGFADQGWRLGPGPFAPLAAGERAASRSGTDWRTPELWLRCAFTVPPGTLPARLYLEVHHACDAEVFVEGRLAGTLLGANGRPTLIPLDARAMQGVRVGGDNTLAVRCRQTGSGQLLDLGVVVALDTLPR